MECTGIKVLFTEKGCSKNIFLTIGQDSKIMVNVCAGPILWKPNEW